MRVLIINGFDRCGSSMIGGLLSRHPGVAYFFQPLSSTEVHRTQYEVWGADHQAPDTESFFRGILNGRLDAGFIAADWFRRHSTASQICPDRLNVIKETKLHFKIDWLRARFPQIAILGIRRDPRAIVCSLMRNDFYRKWYGEAAFDSVCRVIGSDPALGSLRPFLAAPLADADKMAMIVAARTRHMSDRLPPGDWIVYEDVLANPNAALGDLARRFGLAPFDFSPFLGEDYNVIGRPFESPHIWRSYFSAEQVMRLDEIFDACGLSAPVGAAAGCLAPGARDSGWGP